MIERVNNNILRAAGRNDFHVSAIRWSYRIRGSVARTHTNSVARAKVFMMIIISAKGETFMPRNRIDENSLITRMFVYSAIKIKANKPALNSTLKPETSSDSPSAKSNGVRFVSAKFVINHRTAKGMTMAPIHVI